MAQQVNENRGGDGIVDSIGDTISRNSFWTLNKILILILAAVFFGLFVDLRYEHVDKIRHHWQAWIPIAYSGIMAISCLVGVLRWESKAREALFYAFTVGIFVGLFGFWLHNHGHIITDVSKVLLAWFKFEHLADAPPTLAPLTYAGLGVVGMLVCSVRNDRIRN